MVDQFVIGFKTQKWWGTLAAADFFLGGTGAGTFLLAMYLGSVLGMVIGWLAVAAGAIVLLIDLGRPGRFIRAGSRLGRSWISRGVFLTSLFLLFGFLRVTGQDNGSLPWGTSTDLGLAIGVLAAIGGVGVMMYTGFLLSHSPAIPFWNTTLLPLLFAVYGLSCGAGVVMVALSLGGGRPAYASLVQPASLWLLGVSLVLTWVYLLTMASSTVAARESVRMLLRGPLWVEFLIGVTLVGLVAPLALVALVTLSSAPAAAPSPVLALAGVLALVGGYLFRRSILRAGVYPPVIDL